MGHMIWTFKENRKMRELFRNGYSDREIAAELGCSLDAVLMHRLKLRLLRRDTPKRKGKGEKGGIGGYEKKD